MIIESPQRGDKSITAKKMAHSPTKVVLNKAHWDVEEEWEAEEKLYTVKLIRIFKMSSYPLVAM